MRSLSHRSAYATNPNDEGNRAAARIEGAGKEVIRLNRGDPAVYFRTPRYILRAYVKALEDGKTYYSKPQGTQELREAIAKRHRRMYGADMSADDVVVTQGISEGLMFLNSALINDGDRAVVFKPYYPLHRNSLNLNGGKPVFCQYDEGRGWDADIDALGHTLKKERGLKYMILANPGNPTGTVLPKSTLKEIAELANEHGLLLISDEIYDELTFNNAKFTSMSEVARGMPHVILNGASKDFDATGFRLGYIAIPENDRFSELLRRKMVDYATMRLCANTPAQYAFAEGISNVSEHRRELGIMLKGIERRINFATRMINESRHMQTVRPNGAFYIFPKLDTKRLRLKDDGEFATKLLEEEHVQLTRGSGFGGPGHIRMVALAPEKILSKAIEKIDKFCRSHSR